MKIALTNENNDIFVQYTPHVNWLEVTSHHGGWRSGVRPTSERVVCLFEDGVKTEKAVLSDLKEIKAYLAEHR